MKRETKGRKEIIAYVAEATGVAPRDVGKVIDATFAFVRDSRARGQRRRPSEPRAHPRQAQGRGGRSQDELPLQPGG